MEIIAKIIYRIKYHIFTLYDCDEKKLQDVLFLL